MDVCVCVYTQVVTEEDRKNGVERVFIAFADTAAAFKSLQIMHGRSFNGTCASAGWAVLV